MQKKLAGCHLKTSLKGSQCCQIMPTRSPGTEVGSVAFHLIPEGEITAIKIKCNTNLATGRMLIYAEL